MRDSQVQHSLPTILLLIPSLFFSTLLSGKYFLLISTFFAFVYLLLNINTKICRSNVNFIYTLLLTLMAFVFFSLSFTIKKSTSEYHDVFESALVNNLIVFSLSAFVSIVFLLSKAINKKSFIYVIDRVLLLQVLAIIIQFVIYNISGQYLDFVNLFTGEESRYFDYKCLNDCGVRYTGLQIEPSTVSSVITILLSIRIYVHRRVNWLMFTSVFSLLLTSSTISYLQFALLLSALILVALPKYNSTVIISMFGLAFLATIPFVFTSDVMMKVLETSILRVRLVEYILNSGDLLFTGHGVFEYADELYWRSSGEMETGRFASVNDLGIFIFLTIKLGVIIAAFIFTFIFIRNLNWISILLIIAISTTKVGFQHPLFWLFMFMFMFNVIKVEHESVK